MKAFRYSIQALSLCCAVGIAAHAATLSVAPSFVNVTLGQNFDLNITIASVADLSDFQFDLEFNPTVLQATTISRGAFLSGAGMTLFEPGVIDNTGGRVTFTAEALEGASGANGSGVLATFGFIAAHSGTSTLTIDNITLLNSNLFGIAATANSGTVSVADTPEPATGALLAAGISLLCILRLRRAQFRKGRSAFPLAAIAALLPFSAARASLMVTPPATGQLTVIDFSQFAGANTLRISSPVQVSPGITVSSTNPDGSLLGSGPYYLNGNGVWNGPLVGLDLDTTGGDQYTLAFHFSNAVSVVGGIMNYSVFGGSGFSDVIMSALDANGALLESWDLSTAAPITTPNGLNQGAFRGIALGQADISYFTLSNSAVALADLSFGTAAVPEPATFALVFAAILAIGIARIIRGWQPPECDSTSPHHS